MEVQTKIRAAKSVGIIGGADGPTSIMVSGVVGTGSVVLEVVAGVVLIAIGIWGLRMCKKRG